MAGDDVGVKFDVLLLRDGAGALQDRVKAARGGSGLFPDFFDEGRHVVDLFDRNHVQSELFCLASASANDNAWKACSEPSLACRILPNITPSHDHSALPETLGSAAACASAVGFVSGPAAGNRWRGR